MVFLGRRWWRPGSALRTAVARATWCFSAPESRSEGFLGRAAPKLFQLVVLSLFCLWPALSYALDFPALIYVTTDVANIRGGPNTEQPVVGKALMGARLRTVEESGGWFRVQFGEGKEGWIYNELVSTDRPVVDPKQLNEAQDYLGKGNLFYNQGQLDEAVEQYQLALEVVPDLADAYYNLANVFYDKEDRPRALEYYQKAIESDPNHAPALYNLGLIYYEEGNYGSAKDEWEKAVGLKPEMIEVRYNLALVYEKFDQERALELWGTYLEMAEQVGEQKGVILRVQEHVRLLKGP